MPWRVLAASPRALFIPPRLAAAAVRRCDQDAPAESVVLLAGLGTAGGRARAVHYRVLANGARDRRHAFRVEAHDLLDALHRTASRGLVPLAILHSHPADLGRASRADASGAWPEFLTVILERGPRPRWRAYRSAGAGPQRTLQPIALAVRLVRTHRSGRRVRVVAP